MAKAKVLATFVHVLDGDGNSVALRPGTTVPAKYADQVTNPACYVEAESVDVPVPVAATAPTVTPAAATPSGPPAAATPTVTPSAAASAGDGEKAIADMSFQDLQAAAKSRGLSGAGNTDTLIARLEADNRDRAVSAAELAAAATPGTTSAD